MENNQIFKDELEQMRQDMRELRLLLSEQQIVNERVMRRAMKRDLGKERQMTVRYVVLAVLLSPVYLFMMPMWGAPLWFAWLTAGFMLLAVVASVWSVRRLMGEDLLTGDLLVVASRIVEYKRFGNNWLKFAIPFLCVWVALFLYYIGNGMEPDLRSGALWGGVIGLVVGTVCGLIYLAQSRQRLNGVLRQIEELRGGE